MASDLNTVALTGRLTKDAEVRHTQGGQTIINIRLAVSTRAKLDDGSWGDRSNYFDVTHFTKAEGLAQYLAKGKPIAVKGRLQWREWTTQEGAKRQSVEVVAEEVILLSSGEGGQQQQRAAAPAPRQQVDDLAGPATAAAGSGFAPPAPDDSDIPF